MNRPTRPLVPEDVGVHKTRPAVYLSRAATATLRAYATQSTAERVAARMWGDGATTEILRAATTPATTTGTGWAAEIVRVAIYDLIQSITSVSAAAELIDRGLQLSMDGVAELRVPGRTLNAAAAGQWVAENAPAPARQLSFTNAAILQVRKLSCIMSYSREQAASSNIAAIVQQSMGEAAGLALDARMFSATAGDSSGPPGLFVGVTGQTPTAGGGSAAMIADIGNLFAALAANGGGKTAVLVCAMSQATTLKMTVGPQFDVPIIASTSLPSGTVAAIEVGSFVSGFSPVPVFRASEQATFHFDDTAPADPVMGGQPVKSMFQTDSLALKMDLFASWGLRAVGHCQWLSGATW